uniref:Uncharacterized protein n=1 Tax=Brassica campestris TaxID=3711 RepID=A0A3P6A1V5_BRACM|nr:unnamed protein product [Brassica rapa]
MFAVLRRWRLREMGEWSGVKARAWRCSRLSTVARVNMRIPRLVSRRCSRICLKRFVRKLTAMRLMIRVV